MTRGPLAGLVRELPLISVLAVASAGFTLVRFSFWRKGLVVIGLAVGLGALLRLVLPERRAGLLAVRGRWRDVITLAVLAAVVAGLAAFVVPLVPPDPATTPLPGATGTP